MGKAHRRKKVVGSNEWLFVAVSFHLLVYLSLGDAARSREMDNSSM